MMLTLKNKSPVSPQHLLPAIFLGRCLVCGQTQNQFDSSPENRLCRRCEVARDWPVAEHAKLVTMLPDWSLPPPIEHLPKLTSHSQFDLFARWIGPTEETGLVKNHKPNDLAAIKKFLPYESDYLRDECHATCGHPVVYRSRRLENWLLTSNEMFVLDMSTLGHSRTHKDLRSWAIVNTAVANQIRHLAVWTAGNAGLSLGLIAGRANLALDNDHQIRIHALFDPGDTSVDQHVEHELVRAGCTVNKVPSTSKVIFPPDKIQQSVKNRALGWHDWDPNAYWDVTDGWEGVGFILFRLIAAQVIRDLKPTQIVLPLGTGNLTVAFLQGMRDCENAGAIAPQSVRLIGATPLGDNIVRCISRRKEMPPLYAMQPSKGSLPIMPKIATTYTPLLAVIDHELQRGTLDWIEVNANDQNQAAEALNRPAASREIQSEPSALAGFAALPRVIRPLSERDHHRILVVNTGNGLLSSREQAYLAKHRIT